MILSSVENAPPHNNKSIRSAKIVDRLLRSDLYRSYQEVFQASTGLPLELHAVDDDEVTACRGSVNQNRFCQLLNSGEEGCRECLMAQRCLANSKNCQVQSIACFAGLQETAVPVVVGGAILAQLKTGQVFHEQPQRENFQKVADWVEDNVHSTALEEAYMETPVVEKQRYQAMVTLLASFSLQLAKLANQIQQEEALEAEDVMSRAQAYIEDKISESIELEELAEKFRMSTFHFCRKFKTTTGTTLTAYLTRRRIELAKEALANTNQRITDIAFNVGFQSLSQFNRSFHKLTGMPPSRFRRQCA